MKLHSTQQSVEAGGPSVLAVVEALVFCPLFVVMLAKIGARDLWAIIFIVPLFLLRSTYSTKLGARWFGHFVGVFRENTKRRSRPQPPLQPRPMEAMPRDKTKRPTPSADRLDAMALAAILLIGVLLLRTIATLVASLRHPVVAIQSIPKNWFRIVFCEDVFTPAHIPPGISKYDLDDDEAGELGYVHRLTIRDSMKRFPARTWVVTGIWFAFVLWQSKIPLGVAIVIIGGSLILSPWGFVIAIWAHLYRAFIKGATALYLPIAWSVRGVISTDPLDYRLEDMARSVRTRLLLNLSLFTVIFFAFKILVREWLDVVADSFSRWHVDGLARLLIRPDDMPIWHIVAAMNACITIVLVISADWALRRKQHGLLTKSVRSAIDLALRSSALLQPLLSTYTIACHVLIVARYVGADNIPSVGRWLP